MDLGAEVAVHKRVEQPRNACVLCRSKKVRCLPSEIPGLSTCQRCYRSGQECQVPTLKIRKRRPKLVNRIEELEHSLSTVTAELAAKRSLEPPSVPTLGPNTLINFGVDASFQTPSSNTEIRSPSTFSSEDDVFDQNVLTEGYAETLLQEFKVMAPIFPYVLAPDPPVSRLRRERPLTLLSVLAVSSWRNRPLQVILEQQYLKEIGERMIMKGEHSMDMLQSLLIHLAWRHLHMKSAYRLAGCAVSLATSLGLDMPSNGTRRLGINFEFNKTFDPCNQPGAKSTEGKRAYIGCYVISTSYALVLRKVGALKYSKHLEECAMSLAAEHEVPSDLSIVHYLRLVHHSAEIDKTFGYGDPEAAQNITEERLEFYLNYFTTQREELKSRIPPELAESRMLHSSYILLQAYTLEVGLYNISSLTLTPFRMSILFDCLLSVKQILDMLLALPDQSLQNLMGYNWAKIHYTINLALELTLGIASPSWNIESARNIIQLETYIDLLCRRLTNLSSQIHKGEEHSDWFQMLAASWANLNQTLLSGLQRKGIHLRTPEINNNGIIPGAHPSLLANGNTSYGQGDFSSIDFMLNDWMWMPQDGNMMVPQA